MAMTTVRRAAAASAVAALLAAFPARGEEALAPAGGSPAHSAAEAAAPAAPSCDAQGCAYRLSPPQLLAIAEGLVAERKFDEARPLVAALRAAPGMSVPYNFLEGMIALETGANEAAADHFRAILKDDPRQTRVRLELARALINEGDLSAADYHLRLAQDADDLPPDIARVVTNARSVLRSRRNWQFGFDFGIAPDTNINSATNAETVDINFGPLTLPLTLDDEARARSGTGLTANVFGSLRLPASEHASIVFDLDASMVNYEGKQADDYSVQLAAGPEWRLGKATTLSLQAVGLHRWYAGMVAARQAGGKLTVQHDLSRRQRLGLQVDARYSDSDFGEAFVGWQIGAVATYEHVVAKSAIASASLFARRDMMKLATNSSSTLGVNLGIGGELPLGINAGISGGVSYSRYDQAVWFFSNDRREDWRWQARAYAGLRQVRVLGFSPSVEYRFASVETNYAFYRSERHRFNFKLARYF